VGLEHHSSRVASILRSCRQQTKYAVLRIKKMVDGVMSELLAEVVISTCLSHIDASSHPASDTISTVVLRLV
jgi:hypothetical protein